MALSAGSIEIKLFADIARLQKDMNKANKTVDAAMNNIDKSVRRAKQAFVGLSSSFAATQVIKLADDYKRFDSQLKLATETADKYAKAYENVVRISKESMSDIGTVGTLYARLTQNLREFGTTQQEISDITEAVSLSLRVSNATVQETNSVMLQLSQSFGSGRINGQEFLAVSEGAPIIMRQLAKSLNVSYGALKDLSAQGQLTSEVLKNALTDPAYLEGLRKQVKEVGTVSSAMTVFTNNLKQFIGESDKATGATTIIAESIKLLGENLNTLANIGIVALIVATGKWVAGIYASIKASQLRQAELIKETVLIERKAAAEAKGAAVSAAAIASKRPVYAKHLGQLNEQVIVMAEVDKRSTIAAKSTRMLGSALMFLGGPIGAIITLLGSLAFAFIDFGKKSQGELGEILRITKELNSELEKTPEKIMQKTASSLDQLAAVRDDLERQLKAARRGSIDFSTGQILIDEQEVKRLEGLLDASLVRYQELIAARVDGERQVKKAVDEAATAEQFLRDEKIKFMSEEIAAQEKIIESARKANISEKDRARIIADAQKAINDLTGATDRLKEAEKLRKDQMESYYKSVNDMIVSELELRGQIAKESENYAAEMQGAQADILIGLYEQAEALQVEINNYGKLESAIEATALARAMERKEVLAGLGLSTAEIEKEIEARKRLVDLSMAKERLDAEKKAAEETQKAWERAEEEKRKEFEKTVDNIDRIFAEGFANMLNGGEGSWKSFTQSLITTFKTTVINEIYKLLLKPFVVNIIASVAGITGSGVAQGAVEGLTGAGGGTGILGTISEGVRALNSNVVGSIQNLGVFISDGMGGIRDTIGGFLGENAQILGNAAAFIPAVTSLIGGDLKSAAFQGAGAAIGTFFGGPVGGAIGSFIGGAVGGLFGGGGEKYKRVLQEQQSSLRNGIFTTSSVKQVRTNDEVANAFAGVSEEISRIVSGLMGTFGLGTDVDARFKGRIRRTSGDFATTLELAFDNVAVSLQKRFGVKGDFAKGFEKMVEYIYGEGFKKIIDASKLPAYVKELFAGITGQENVTRLVAGLDGLNRAAEGLNERFGITVEQTTQVARSLGLSGEALMQFIEEFGAVGASFNSVGKTILDIKDALQSSFGAELPATLKEFDAALKGIDKTTQAGIDAFAQLLTLRPQFEEFTVAVDALKSGVRTSIYSMVSDNEKLLMQRADMQKIFDEYGYDVPGSVAELVNLGKNIDFTTEAGLNLAAVFPNLVSVFMETQKTVDGLIGSMSALDARNFSTLVDYQRARSYMAGGISLSQLPAYANGTDYVPNTGLALVHQGERIIPADENARNTSAANSELVTEVRMLRAENETMKEYLRKLEITAKNTETILRRVSLDGNSIQVTNV